MITNSSKKELDSKKEELISVDLREIVEEPLDTSSVLGLSDEEQIKHYDKQLGGLSQNAIKSQADQIINYADNYLQSGILPVATLFENCSMVMEKHIKEDELIPKKSFENFKMSLRNSQDCIKNSSRYLEKINELKDSKCSFIMAPINAIGHVFSAAIYKKGENYEVILDRKDAINKGVSMLSDNDVLLILGKGHEDYQIIKGVKYHLDDMECVNEAIKNID